jgi:hypothetical protein
MPLTRKFIEIPESEHDAMLDMLSDAENKRDEMAALLKDIKVWLRDRVGGWEYIESSAFFSDKNNIVKRIEACLPNPRVDRAGEQAQGEQK